MHQTPPFSHAAPPVCRVLSRFILTVQSVCTVDYVDRHHYTMAHPFSLPHSLLLSLTPCFDLLKEETSTRTVSSPPSSSQFVFLSAPWVDNPSYQHTPLFLFFLLSLIRLHLLSFTFLLFPPHTALPLYHCHLVTTSSSYFILSTFSHISDKSRMPSPRRHHHHRHNNSNTSQKAHYLEQLEHIIEDEKQLFYDLANINNNQSPPTCTRHPRWITFGCIIFSVMLSSTLFMTKNWQSRTSIGRSGGALDGEREWRWPEMDPWKAIALAEKENSEESTSPSPIPQPQQGPDQRGQGSNEGSPPNAQGTRTWDLNDPALALGTFLDSLDWKSQPLIPGANFVNLLRALRPVDHAFFITLFVNQSPGRLETAREEGKGMSPKASAIPIHGQHGCGSWIQDYIEYQNAILDETLAARYTVHACSSATTHTPSQKQEQEQKHEQERGEQPCGDVFSQMIAMTSAFTWSVKESRGFFLRPDQIHKLQDSFQSPVLQQQWSFPSSPRLKAVSAAKVDTEEMISQDLEILFGLEDALFSGTDDGVVDQAQDRLWVMRSKSRNRDSFERTLPAPNNTIVHPYQPSSQLNRGDQQHPRKAMTPIQVKKLKDDLESDSVELTLQQDLLPLFVNTTHTLDQFIDLGLPLPDRILEDH